MNVHSGFASTRTAPAIKFSKSDHIEPVWAVNSLIAELMKYNVVPYLSWTVAVKGLIIISIFTLHLTDW